MALSFKIKYSKRFDNDISGIYEYIAYKLQNPHAATEQLNRIMSAVETVGVFPKIHRVRGKDKKGNEFRLCPVDNYVIIYFFDDVKNIVNISRVLYAKRNITEIIFL